MYLYYCYCDCYDYLYTIGFLVTYLKLQMLLLQQLDHVYNH